MIKSETLSEPGPFVAGFQFIKYVDKTREMDTGGRPVPVFFFYPADPKSVSSTTPLASYPLDPFYGTLPEVLASEFVAAGDDPSYAGLPASRKKGPFPLVLFSPGYQFDANQYIYVGTRLASHGIVVAILSHRGEASWSVVADPSDADSVVLGNRPKDMSFALTNLLEDSRTKDVFDHSQVLAAGHSYGGYTALALSGGDDNVCDVFESFGIPEPDGTCTAVTPDPRFKAVISLDGSSWLLAAVELARVHVPSLGVGEDEAALEASAQGLPGYNARPHAFIGARSSYRVDVNHTTHLSYSETCAGWLDILTRAGVFPNERMTQDFSDTIRWLYCSCPTPDLDGDCVLDAQLGHDLTTRYMIAFINAYVSHGAGRNVLVPKCGQKQETNIDLFTTEVGGDHHLGPNIDWLAPLFSTEQFDYYVNQADVPCEDEQ